MVTPVYLADNFKEDVDSIIETTYRFLLNNGDEDWIQSVYAMREVNSWEYIHSILKRVVPIAHIIGTDGEIPNARIQLDFMNFVQRYSKLGTMHLWDETRLMAMGRAIRDASGDGQAMANAISEFFMAPQGEMIEKLMDTARYLTLQQLFTLQVDYTDPRTEAKVELDFQSLANTTLWPAALTGAALWDQRATADGLTNLDDHLELYYRVNRRYPQEITMHYSLLMHLLNQESTENFISESLDVSVVNLGNSNRSGQRLALLNNILQQAPMRNGQMYPMIRTYERVFPIQTNATDIELVEGVPLDRYCFVDRQPRRVITENGMGNEQIMGIGLWGPNIESALNGAGNSELDPLQVLNNVQSGPFAWTELVSSSSFASNAVGNYVPIPFDVDSYGGRKVIA